MGEAIKIENSTIITGATSEGKFVLAKINDKHVGIPIYKFSSSSPELDFVSLENMDIKIYNSTLYDVGTSYGAAVALYVNTSAFGLPIYKVPQDTSKIPQIVFQEPSIVSNITYNGLFLAVNINKEAYGIPIVNYSSIYPFTTTQAMSSIVVKTITNLGGPTIIDNALGGSTNLNAKIRTYQSLINRIMYQLGAPFINLEICEDTQMVDFIDKAIEWYTKYAGYTEEFLVFSSELYQEPGLRIDKLFSITPTMKMTNEFNISGSWDYDLDDYRKVIGVFSFEQGETTGINTLFTLEQSMAQQTYFSYMLGNVGFDLVTWEVLKGWLELREKVLAQRAYVDFDNRNQLLRIIPAPNHGSRYYGAIGAWVEKPIRDLIMERWIEQYALALTKIAIGNVRGKYQSVQMFGGGTINYNDLMSQGLEEKKKLEEELMNFYGEVTPARFFLG